MTSVEMIAQHYYELSLSDQWKEIVFTLFDENAVSMEPAHTFIPIALGVKQISDNIKIKRGSIADKRKSFCSKPLVAGVYFTCAIGAHFTTSAGIEVKMEEIVVLKVKGDKIVSQQFFY